MTMISRLTGKRRPRAVASTSPVSQVNLDGLKNVVQRIVALPGGERVVTASVDGGVNIYSAATGDLVHAIEAHQGKWGPAGLTAIGGNMFASAGCGDGNISTWGAGAGQRLGSLVAGDGSGVRAIKATGEGSFVAGTRSGDLLFYSHREGRDITEVARVTGAHASAISDIASYNNKIVTASYDRTAAVWDIHTREQLAVLCNSSSALFCASINEWSIVTGSHGKSIRVYSAEDYSIRYVLHGLHENAVWSVELIGEEHILSSSADQTLCLTNLANADGTIESRTVLGFGILSASIMRDARIAVAGYNGCASIIKTPQEATNVLTAHLAARQPPPLQDALAKVFAGQAVASEVCRTKITATSCSASMSEWKAAHELMMLGASKDEQAAGCSFDGKRNWWLLTLYTLARAPSSNASRSKAGTKSKCTSSGTAEDGAEVSEKQSRNGEQNYDLLRHRAALNFITARKDLVEGLYALRSAADDIRELTLNHRVGPAADLTQDALLASLTSAHKAHGDAPSDDLLASIFLHLVLVISGAVGSGYDSALEILQDFFGMKDAAVAVRAVLRDAALMLSRVSLGALTEKEENRLEAALSALAMPDIPTLRGLFLAATPPDPSEEVRKAGIGSGSGVGVGSGGDGGNGAGCGDVGDRGGTDPASGDKSEGLTEAEGRSTKRRSLLNANPGIEADPGPSSAIDQQSKTLPPGGDCGVSIELDESEGQRVDVAVAAGSDRSWYAVVGATRPRERISALSALGISRIFVRGLSRSALASCVAAYMICYDTGAGPRFVSLEACLGGVFAEEDLTGLVLAGEERVSVEDFVSVVLKGLDRDSSCSASLGYKVRLRAFMAALESGDNLRSE